MSEYITLDTQSLLMAVGFLLPPLILNFYLRLELGRDLLVSTIRCYLQLLLLGYLLESVFDLKGVLLILVVYGFMCSFAVHHICRLNRDLSYPLLIPTAVSVFLTGFLMTCLVTHLVGVQPWHKARYFIPLGGMILGNSMNGIVLAYHRYFKEISLRRDEVMELLSLGASAWESARDSIRSALQAGLIPAINSTATAGIVWIPGIMTGQVLSGIDPMEAARYQILVFLMILGAVGLGIGLCILLAYKLPYKDETLRD
jgi:putative ABC transport system permease protein